MNTRWTRGPWSCEQSMRGDGTPLPEWVVSGCDIDVDGEERVVGIAYRGVDARLIAAAPALAEALEKALPLLRLLTVRQVIEAGDEAIDAAGLNPWAINEGLATGDEPIGVWKFADALASAKGEQ